MPRHKILYDAVPNHDPLVKWLVEEVNLQYMSDEEVCIKAGISKNCIHDWRHGSMPTLGNFEAALAVLGYKLEIVDASDN